MTEQDESSLCVTCGLCCDGTLFRFVKVKDHEYARLERLGLAIDRSDPPRFFQPCSKLSDCRCTIYPERPGTCRTFACALIERTRTGAVSLDAARGIVATARLLRDRASAADAPVLPDESADARRADATRRLHHGILDHYLRRHFRKDKARRGAVAVSVAATTRPR